MAKRARAMHINPFPCFPQFHCLCSEDYFLRREKQQKHFICLFNSQREFIRILAMPPMSKCNLRQINDESTSWHVGPSPPVWTHMKISSGYVEWVSLANASLGRTQENSRERKSWQKEIILYHSFQGPAKKHKRILKVLGKLLPAKTPTASIQSCCYGGRGWKS